jgi:hypothetical protein
VRRTRCDTFELGDHGACFHVTGSSIMATINTTASVTRWQSSPSNSRSPPAQIDHASGVVRERRRRVRERREQDAHCT